MKNTGTILKDAKITTYLRKVDFVRDEEGEILANQNNMPYIKAEEGMIFKMEFPDGVIAEVYQKDTGTEVILTRTATETETLMGWTPPTTEIKLGATLPSPKIIKLIETTLELLTDEDIKQVKAVDYPMNSSQLDFENSNATTETEN